MTSVSFLVISQKAIGSPDFSLKDLPGHGRFDVVARSLLQSSKKDFSNNYCDFYSLLKGDKNIGWLSWRMGIPDGDDEVSISAILQAKWNEYFTRGSLSNFLIMFEKDHPNFQKVLLSENGSNFSQIDYSKDSDVLIILGAQHDLVEADLTAFTELQRISLGSQSMLASHAIAYFRMKWDFFD